MSIRSAIRFIVIFSFLFCGAAQAMTSTDFTIGWDSINSGGRDDGSSTNFLLRDTLGEQATGESTSANFSLLAGYRYGEVGASVLSFDIGTQENSTEIAYTAFSNLNKTVTVASAASFSVGSFIAVVESKGAGQVVAIGKIASIVGTVITVDRWDGSAASIGASPSGSDDFVYRLDGDAAQLGTLSTSVVATSVTHTDVSTDVSAGYSVYLHTDGSLRTGSASITGVSDGVVTAGAEEYGARVFGSMATGTGSDFALSTTERIIQESDTVALDERIALVYKAAINANTVAGNYSQLIFYTVTANF